MPSSIINVGEEIWLYYLGWVVRRDVPFETSVGLAISRDAGQSFIRAAPGPVFSRGLDEQFSILGPLVTRHDKQFVMFYPSVRSWQEWQGRLEARYSLRAADSQDGMNWRARPGLALEFSDQDEGGLTRPAILKYGNRYHMWYSRRGWERIPERCNSSISLWVCIVR